jgi:phosphatidylglycerophosphate synthase
VFMSRRKWVSLAFLSIMIPVGLLATFRLTGVLEEPPTPEIITTETVKWSMQRPAETIFEIGESIENSYADNVTLITFEFIAYSYKEASGVFFYNDVLMFILNATADLSQGYIRSVAVKFSPTDVHAISYLGEYPFFVRLSNLRMSVFRTKGTSEQKAYIEASAVDRPQFCSLKTVYDAWVFTDENNFDHQMSVALEVTYFNGTKWKEVKLPLEICVHA